MQLNSIADWHPNHMLESIKSNYIKEINANEQEVIFSVVLCFLVKSYDYSNLQIYYALDFKDSKYL